MRDVVNAGCLEKNNATKMGTTESVENDRSTTTAANNARAGTLHHCPPTYSSTVPPPNQRRCCVRGVHKKAAACAAVARRVRQPLAQVSQSKCTSQKNYGNRGFNAYSKYMAL